MRFRELPLHVRHTFYYDLRSGLLIGVFGGFLMPFITIVGRKIGATEFQVALLAASPYIANASALLWTEDVFGKGRVWYVVWPAAAGRLLLVGMFYVTHPAWYTFLIFSYMIVTAVPFPSYASIMKTNYPDSRRGALMSYIRVGIAVSWIIASAFAGWVLEKDTYNYRYIFPAAALFGVLSALQFRAIKVRREKKEKVGFPALSDFRGPLRDAAFKKFLIIFSLFEFALLLALPVYPLVLVDSVRISNLATGVYGAVYSGMWLAGFFFWGGFLDRHAGRAFAAIFLVAASVPFIYLSSSDVYVLGIAQGAAGFVFAATELACYVVITRLSTAASTARYMAANIALGGLRGATAPFIGTAIYSAAGAEAVFSLSLVLALAAILLALKLYRVDNEARVA